MNDETAGISYGVSASAYENARQAFDAQRWADTIKHSAQVLAGEPHHAGAFELLSAARRHLERLGAPAGEQRILSVLMCDLVDSTRLPRVIGREPYRNLLRDLQQVCASAVTRYEGRVAQYLGDGILAYFSYPQAHEDDPLRAALAALAIVDGVKHVRAPEGPEGRIDVAVRIGIDTGVVMVGAMGAGQWTTTDSIVGDPPNFAARLQAIAPANGIVASAATQDRIARYVEAKPLRARTFKGFEGRRRSYQVLSVLSADTTATAIRRNPLIGRDAERAALSSAWRDALEGERRVLAVVGDAGMGKTRLADELVNVALATGGTTVTIRCSALHQHVPFHPVAAAVRRLLAFPAMVGAPSIDVVRERLSTIAGSAEGDDIATPIALLLGSQFDDGRTPEQRRERLLSILVSLVRSVATGKRFLLLIEDLHDADPSTLEFIGRIVATVREPFALVATARPHARVSSYLTSAQRIELGALSDESCRVLAKRVLGLREHLVESAVTRASGSPLFVEELARWLARGQSLGRLPPALDLLLTTRIDMVEPELRDLLVTASVIGADFEVADLAELSGLSRAVTYDRLEHLAADGLVDAVPEQPETMRRFRHSLFRDAAYQRLLPSERARRHLRLAEHYEKSQGDERTVPPAIIARHLLDGAAPARALGWWQRAALDARATAAHTEAVEHFGAAIALLDVIDEPAERTRAALQLHLGLAESASMVMGYTAPRVRQAFEEANTLADAMPHAPERFTARMGLHTFALVTGQLERAEGLVMGALRDVAGRDLPGLEGTAYASQAYVRFFRGRLAEARPLCLLAAAAVPTIGVPQDPALVNRFLLGMIEWLEGDDAAAERTCNEAMLAASNLQGERAAFTRTFLLTYLAWKAQMAEDPAAARTYATQAIALSQEHGFAQWLCAATLHLGAALCDLGELETGKATLTAALAAWRGAGAGLMTPYFMGRLALAHQLAGDHNAALATFDDAIALARGNDERLYLAELHRLRARCRIASGEAHAVVAEDLAVAIAVAEALGHRVFAVRALVERVAIEDEVSLAAPELQRQLDAARDGLRKSTASVR